MKSKSLDWEIKEGTDGDSKSNVNLITAAVKIGNKSKVI